jgi:hypothetical protein
MKSINQWYRILFCISIIFFNSAGFSQDYSFDYSRYLLGTPSTMSVGIQTINASTGYVVINGGDSMSPSYPFTWYWGDGDQTSGFFPQSHTYSDNQKNYLVKIIANYSDGTKDSAFVVIRFTSPQITPVEIPSWLAVKIPEDNVSLGTRLYQPPDNLTAFNDSYFTSISRSALEYVLSVCAMVQSDFVNNDIFLFDEKFEQIMLRDSTFGGAYSLWFTNPVAFGVGEGFLSDPIQYSSFFHEMGHNITLNTPADYYYGGRIDGDANAIYSESMADIFQHATGYEIVNNYQSYGLSVDLMYDIRLDLISTVTFVRKSYERYISDGKPFASWNDPNTVRDETLNTFLTITYKFLEKAETSGLGYKDPLKRMLKLLQGFNFNWAQRYDQYRNTAEADTFRATLMVSAISYAFSIDLRDEFRDLNFPISDEIFDELYHSVTSIYEETDPIRTIKFDLNQNYPNPFNPTTTINFSIPQPAFVKLKIYDTLGREVETLLSKEIPGGNYSVQWDASKYSSGVYYYSLSADGFNKTKQLMILK